MPIESFLTRKVAKQYSMKHHGLGGIFVEIFLDDSKLIKHFNEEILVTTRFRSAIMKALSSDPDEQKEIAERWVHFIKPRISVLKFWSVLFSTFISLYGLGSAIFVLAGQAVGESAPMSILFSFLGVSLILLILKYIVEKKSFWYEFVAVNLEAISETPIKRN